VLIRDHVHELAVNKMEICHSSLDTAARANFGQTAVINAMARPVPVWAWAGNSE